MTRIWCSGREIMDSAVFGVQQNRAAISASVINCVIARIQNGRGTDNGADRRIVDVIAPFGVGFRARYGRHSAPELDQKHINAGSGLIIVRAVVDNPRDRSRARASCRGA